MLMQKNRRMAKEYANVKKYTIVKSESIRI